MLHKFNNQVVLLIIPYLLQVMMQWHVLNRRNEDFNLLWRYHIVPGRFDDLAIYNLAQDKYTQANPRIMAITRPQNNLATLAKPFQVYRKF